MAARAVEGSSSGRAFVYRAPVSCGRFRDHARRHRACFDGAVMKISLRRLARFTGLPVALALFACGGSSGEAGDAGSPGSEAGLDGQASSDARADSGHEASAEAGSDASPADAGADGPLDAPPDTAPVDASEAGPTTPPEGIISASPMSAFEGETQVAVSSGGTVAASWSANPDPNSVKGQFIGTAFWVPGSSSWTPVQKNTMHTTDYATDSTVIADHEGNFYVAWLGFDTDAAGNFLVGHIYVAKAPKGSTSFGPPILVSVGDDSNTLLDKPWLAVTQSGALLISYLWGNASTSGILVARSTDGGTTWGHTLVDNTQNDGLAYLCVPSGSQRIYFVDSSYVGMHGDNGARPVWNHRWLERPFTTFDDAGAEGGPDDAGSPDAGSADGAVDSSAPDDAGDAGDAAAPTVIAALHWSDDDGVTWPGSNTDSVPNNLDIMIPSCAAMNDDVWIEYGLSNSPTGLARYAVRVMHLTGGGTTEVGDTLATANETAPLFLGDQIVVRSDGALDLTLYTGSADPSAGGDFRHTVSSDQGASFPASSQVHAPITFTSRRHVYNWLGDYVGMRGASDVTYVTYPENAGADGHSHIAFRILR